jgi:hypothetical protein
LNEWIIKIIVGRIVGLQAGCGFSISLFYFVR